MNSGASPRDIYSERLARRGESLKELLRRRDRIGYLRLAAVLAAATAIWYAFHGFSSWWIAAPVAAFIALAYWQSRVERQAECIRRAIRFYEQGIARLEHRWQGNGESGARFSDPHHPY